MRKELHEENRLTAGQGLPGMEYEEGIKDFKNLYRMHLFLWRIDEIVMALLNAG